MALVSATDWTQLIETLNTPRLTRQVPIVEQELLTLPEHLSSTPVFSNVHVTRSLALCVCFEERCLSLCPLCCLFFFDLRVLIAPLVSSNSSDFGDIINVKSNIPNELLQKHFYENC